MMAKKKQHTETVESVDTSEIETQAVETEPRNETPMSEQAAEETSASNDATNGSEAHAEEKSEQRDYGEQFRAIVRPYAHDITTTQGATKALQLVIIAEILTGEHAGKLVKYQGLFNDSNPKQFEQTKEAIKLCGASFDVDPKTHRFKGFGSKNPSAIIGWETIPAKDKQPERMELRIKFLNSPTGVRNAIDDDAFAAFAKTLKSGSSDSAADPNNPAVTDAQGKKLKF